MKLARINILHARKANVSVIFRRGPSKWTQILTWNTTTDEIQEGQWFRGSLYPARSDVSPYGNYMIYFAGKFLEKKDQYTWTAISKPPYLTAIALWKKSDTFGGGGFFESTRKIYLNHRKHDCKPEPFSDISQLKITLNTSNWLQVHGLDAEVERMKRNKWKWSTTKAENINKADVQIAKKINDSASIIYIGKKLNHREYSWRDVIKYKDELLFLDNADNIDINTDGRILLSQNGCIYSIDDLDYFAKTREFNLVADLNENKPYELEAPEEMKKW